MNTIKVKGAILASLITIFVLGLISSAGAISGERTLCVFDPMNGSEKTFISLDEDNSYHAAVPAVPTAPSGKVFLGWASQSAGQKYPTIEFWREDIPSSMLNFGDGVNRYYFADYASLRPAGIYPNINFGYLSEHTDGYALSFDEGYIEDVCANDYYSVQLTAGTKYYFQLNMPGRTPEFYLYDKDFAELASGDGSIANTDTFAHYGDSIIEYTPTTSGTYYLGVCASWYDEMGFYQMIASTQKATFPKFKVEWISVGNVVRTSELDPGENIKPPAIARRGYTFAGWYRDTAFTKAFKTDEEIMPVAHIAFFAKWTSNDSKLKGMSKSAGYLTQRWTRTNYINRLRIRRSTSKVTIRPVRSYSKATVYMKYKGGTYKAMNSMRISLKRGQTKTVYIKCVSQTGTKYTSVYKLFVTRNR